MKLARITPFGGFDNASREYAHIMLHPLSGAMGAEILGPGLAAMDDDELAEVLDALYRHKMVFFRGQKISHTEHQAFSARLGEFSIDSFGKGVPGSEHVHALIKEPGLSPIIFGGLWHTDSAFLDQPPSITTLRSVEVPPYGGDTLWANLALAYAMLSPTMQAMLEPLKVHMSPESIASVAQAMRGSTQMPTDSASPGAGGQFHPLVRTHPVTGEKALYVDECYAVAIAGLMPAESSALLEFLARHVTQHAFTCRLRWEPDMLVMWDNRLCIHHACNDYEAFRREMYRTTIKGEVPQ